MEQLSPKGVMIAEAMINAEMASSLLMLRMDIRASEKRRV
jgi:hypothetical protein